MGLGGAGPISLIGVDGRARDMSLDLFSASSYSGATYPLTAETGFVVAEFGLDATMTGTDEAFAPTSGETVIKGYHFNNVTTFSTNGVLLSVSSGPPSSALGDAVTLSNSLVLGGHSNANSTVVVTGMSTAHQMGQLKRITISGDVLASIPPA
jgi:hypothetical protein